MHVASLIQYFMAQKPHVLPTGILPISCCFFLVVCSLSLPHCFFASSSSSCSQTGAGKTYTMMGGGPEAPPEQQGLYMMAARDIFAGLQNKDYAGLSVWVSFFEIYGGKLFDLLNARKRLQALEDADKNVCISGLEVCFACAFVGFCLQISVFIFLFHSSARNVNVMVLLH